MPRKPRTLTEPPRLYSLTSEQARWLIAARDTDGGVYVPITSGPEPYDLAESNAATWREVRQSSGTRSLRDPRPCEWTDSYLVPTQHGLELLARHQCKIDNRRTFQHALAIAKGDGK